MTTLTEDIPPRPDMAVRRPERRGGGAEVPIAASTSAPPSSGRSRSRPESGLAHRIDGGALFPLFLKTILLSIVTLGIYAPWAKTEVRRAVLGRFRYQDEPFIYTGRGSELFFGLLIVTIVLAVPGLIVFLSAAIAGPSETDFDTISLILTIPFAIAAPFLMGAGKFRARRYRLSRITWRGIRGHLNGDTASFALNYGLRTLLLFPTLGLAAPYRDGWMHRTLIGQATFGDIPVESSLEGTRLMRHYWLPWLLLIPTFGASMHWYKAALYREIAATTKVDGLSFENTMTGGRYFAHKSGNGLILAMSFGLAMPFIWQRNADLVLENLIVRGKLDTDRLHQARGRRDRLGEGLAESFDLDVGF